MGNSFKGVGIDFVWFFNGKEPPDKAAAQTSNWPQQRNNASKTITKKREERSLKRFRIKWFFQICGVQKPQIQNVFSPCLLLLHLSSDCLEKKELVLPAGTGSPLCDLRLAAKLVLNDCNRVSIPIRCNGCYVAFHLLKTQIYWIQMSYEDDYFVKDHPGSETRDVRCEFPVKNNRLIILKFFQSQGI